MTPDLAAIRAALAAAESGPHGNEYRDRAALRVNAPVWLASLCDEIERLHDELALTDDPIDVIQHIIVEKDKAHHDNEWLRREYDTLSAERDAALAELERLRRGAHTNPNTIERRHN